MERVKIVLGKLPVGILSVLTSVAILWLTLAPKPLGDEPPSLFQGADKIVHGIMFGGLTWMMLLDWQRKHKWRRVGWQRGMTCAAISSLFGILIEFTQSYMDLGRGFEYADIMADTIGAFIFAWFWITFQKFWV